MLDAFRQIRRKIAGALPHQFHPYFRAQQSIVRLSGSKVMSGPFKGQEYMTSSADYVDPEMLLGIYEMEVQGIVEQIIREDFDTFIDVGSAQGYYVIGIAQRCRRTKVVGFEISKPAIEQFTRAAEANGVTHRILLKGNCDERTLNEALESAGRACILIDVDGYEKELLDPDKVSLLRTTTILAEEHSFIVPGLKDLLIERFSPSHVIKEIPSRLRTKDDLPSGYQSRWHVLNINRRADQQSWLWMEPRAKAP